MTEKELMQQLEKEKERSKGLVFFSTILAIAVITLATLFRWFGSHVGSNCLNDLIKSIKEGKQ